MTRTTSTLRVAGEDVSLDSALDVCLGYCLGRRTLALSPPSGSIDEMSITASVGAFAFDVYDAVAASPGPSIEPIDVLVANGLNAQMKARDIAAALSVGGAVGVELANCRHLPAIFWQLPRTELMAPATEPASIGRSMWRAWAILMGVPGVDVARAHKILHHKMPMLFPLIDNKTIGELRPGEAWLTIHDDLTEADGIWERLEKSVNEELLNHHLPRTSRLRLHDILLWTRVTGNRDDAARLGQELRTHRTGSALDRVEANKEP